LFRLQKEWDEKRKKPREKHKNGKQELPETTAQSDNRVAGTEINADEGEGSGTKRKSPVPSAGGKSDEKQVEPGAGQRGGGADKPMERRQKRIDKPGTTLRLDAGPAVGKDGPEPAELVFHQTAQKTFKITVYTKTPLEEFTFSCGPQLRCRFELKPTKAFIITVADDATREDSPQKVLFYHNDTQQKIAVIWVYTYPAAPANSSQQPAAAANSSKQPADAADSSKQPADAAGSSKQPADAAGSRHEKTLGLSYGASETQIKEAYRKKVLEVHPDKGIFETGEKFIELQEAYEALLAQKTAPAAGGTSP
jgi:hypothetical protein